MSSIHKRWWFWALFVVLCGGAYYGLQYHQRTTASDSTQQNRRQPVGVAVARKTDVKLYLSGLGDVTPIAIVTVKSQVNGQIMKLSFQEGQLVHAGDVLAEIDQRLYQAKVSQAQGKLASDLAQLQEAQIELQRYSDLLAQDSIAKQEVDTKAALVKQYRGTVKSDQGALDEARLQLNYTRITAPISGRLGLRQADQGNIVSASDEKGIVVMTQLQPITVVFSITEDHIPSIMKQLKAGKHLLVEAWDREQKHQLATGTLLTLDNVVDPETGTVKLKAQFPNTDDALFPRQFVNIRLLLDVEQGVVVVPTAAIQSGAKGAFVYVIKNNNTVAPRLVRTGSVQDDMTVIKDGINVGETVVVDGVDQLYEGATVESILRDNK